MADVLDEAQRLADLHLADAMAAHHRRIDDIHGMHSRINCEDCGERIPEKRRQAVKNCRRCLSCQMDFERGGHK